MPARGYPASRRVLVPALATVLLAAGCGEDLAPQVADARDAAALFTDIAAESGLAFEHFLGATGEYYFPETIGSGVALLDYDGDGDLDVYLLQGRVLQPGKTAADALFAPPDTHWPGNRLFRNDLIPGGTLRFTDVTDDAGTGDTGYGMGAAVGDYDNDGDVDLYVTNVGTNVLYRNEGGGRFADVTAESGVGDPLWSASAAFVDYDRDGDLDLFVTNYVDFNVNDHKHCMAPSGGRDFCSPLSYTPLPDRLYRNDGGSRFTDVSAEAGLGAAFGSGLGVKCADFNDDGWPDIYVANDGRPNQLWINTGDGRFREDALMSGTAYNGSGVPEASMGVTAGDFDNDGDDDLFMTHLNKETNTLYLNDGTGQFMDTTNRFGLGRISFPYTGFGTAWFDYDNNGYLDLFVANGAVKIEETLAGSPYPYQQLNQLFRNRAGEGFEDISAQAGPALALFEVSRGAAFGDIDNDGDVDIVVSNNNGPVRLLRNETGNRNHWLTVQLQGVSSSRDGSGARVALARPGQPLLWRRSQTDGSYLSANDPRVHFGLGQTPDIDTVLVKWPSGRTETWRDIRADSTVHLLEGTGEPVAGDPVAQAE